MDLSTLVGIVVALVALWALLLVLFWVLRPKGVSAREILGLIPDVLRLLRSVMLAAMSDRSHRFAELNERARRAFLEGAAQEWRQRHGRPPTAGRRRIGRSGAALPRADGFGSWAGRLWCRADTAPSVEQAWTALS